MSLHTKEQREFIVRQLAAFYSPKDIVSTFALRWPDTACSEADIVACNPKLSVVSPELCALFEAERVRFMETVDDLAPTKDKRVRLVELHRIFEAFRNNRMLGAAAEILGRIAAEMGDVAPVSDAPPVTSITRTVIDPAKPAA
jgi:hypothetical protein